MGNKAVTRYLEYKDEKSSKFWEISVVGNGFTVRYGKIGTDGQVQTKEFADAASAEKQAQKLIAEKTGKGYQEGAGGKESLSNSAPIPDTQTKPKKPAKAAKNKPLTPSDIAKNPESTAEALASLVGSSETIDRLLAKHPRAGADLLEKLSHSSDKATRNVVCLNPNTSKETLIRLAPQFPGDFFQNPAFDWLLLEDPNLLFDIGGGVLKNILKRPECPLSFLKWAASHGDEGQQLATAMNPHTPLESLRELLKSEYASVVSLIEILANDNVSMVRNNVSCNPTCPTSVLEKLARSEDHFVRGKVAANPNCPVSILHEMMAETTAKIEAMNQPPSPLTLEDCVYPGCPPKLKLLAALQPDCPKDQLFKSANSSDPLERLAAGLNPMLPTAQVMRLLDDPDVVVQRAAARHPNCKLASEVH